MKRILPFLPTLYSATSHQSSFLGVLAPYNECYPWIFSNYIQLATWREFYINGSGIIDFFYHIYGYYTMSEYMSCPWINFFRYDRDDIKKNYNNLAEFIIDKINNSSYIYLTLNIGEIGAYNRKGYHQAIVYGYDLDRKSVYIADNIQDGKYVEKIIQFDEINKSFNVPNNEDYIYGRPQGVILLKKTSINEADLLPKYTMAYRNMFRRIEYTKFKKKKVKQDILRYLNIDNPYEYEDSGIEIYGQDCVREFVKYLKYLKENNEQCDLRSICCLSDHKLLMTKRIEFMKENNYIPYDFNDFTEIYNDFFKCRNILIKFNINQSKALLDRCIELVENAMHKECVILKALADLL